MDPAAAAAETTSALRSALDAARHERQALAERIDEVDQLIADLAQAAQNSAEAPQRQRSAGKRTGRKATGTRSTRKQAAKKAGKKSSRRAATRQGRKATTRGSSQTRQEPGRTDRVVALVDEADGPLTTAEVRSRLASHEPDVSSQVVSASLSYARRKGRITKTDDGRWTSTS